MVVIILVNVTHPLPNSYRGGTLTLFELLHVSFLGEAEFWMSCVKLLVMTTLILTCFVISMDGQPSGKRIGFSYWNDPGAFGEYLNRRAQRPPTRILGSHRPVDLCLHRYRSGGRCIRRGAKPQKTIRSAIRQTLWRIVFFYIIGAVVLGMAVPYTNDQLTGGTKQKTGVGASPFVIAVQLAGIPHFPDVIKM